MRPPSTQAMKRAPINPIATKRSPSRDQRDDVSSRSADSNAHAELARPLRYEISNHAVEACRRHDQCQCRERAEQRGAVAPRTDLRIDSILQRRDVDVSCRRERPVQCAATRRGVNFSLDRSSLDGCAMG